MKTNLNDVEKVVRYAFKQKEHEVLDSITATTHEVYIVKVDEKKYAIRIATKDKPAFYTELWALKSLNIPAPELIAWDDSKKVVPYRFTVETFIEGDHISWTGKEKLKRAYDNVSERVLKKIHSTTGYFFSISLRTKQRPLFQ